MLYNEALSYIKSSGVFGSKLGLESISALLEEMGNPQIKVPCIHIAGTNGKGSVAAYISTVLKECGYKTGLFTSPPIEDETERIKINGKYIPRETFSEITETIISASKRVEARGIRLPTEFEIFTAMAFEYFYRENAEIAVIETGMGGRLDATNVCMPVATVITAISYDHTEWLGDTLEKIAFEKAGIIKKDVPVILYPQQEQCVRDVITKRADELNCKLYDLKNFSISVKKSNLFSTAFDMNTDYFCLDRVEIALIGEHQIKNCVTACCALFSLMEQGFNISDSNIKNGLKKTKWNGRFEIRQKDPLLIFDGGHNKQCADAIKDSVNKYLDGYRKILVFSMFKDKDYKYVTSLFNDIFDDIIITQMSHVRSADAELLAYCFDNQNKTIIRNPVAAVDFALNLAKKYEKDSVAAAVVVCGSLNLLEEIIKNSNY